MAATQADLGRSADARGHLDRALATSPYSPCGDLPEARALGDRLGAG